MRIFLLVCLFLICCGCSTNHPSVTKSYQPSEKEKVTDIVLARVANQSAKKFGLIPFGSGGQMMYQIEKLNLAFQYREPANKEKAQALLVGVVNEFLAPINEDEKIRPYLANYPFEPKNIQVTIFFQDEQGRRLKPGTIRLARAEKGLLKYDMDDPETHETITAYKETFAEAANSLLNVAPQNHD